MSLATWYHQQYSSWNRTRRLQQSPYLARTETNVSRVATAQYANGGGGNNVEHLLPQNDSNGYSTNRDKKSLDPLFGPNIGAVTSGPAWTGIADKKVVTDELTPDVVSGWIEKSKDPSQATTTLQALVNLKRPSLRLSPLHSIPEDNGNSDPEHNHHHGLEFEYDSDAPKCGIYVHAYLPKAHPDAPPAPPHHPYAKLLVFEIVVGGGFGKHLTLEEGALLELGRFEHIPKVNPETLGSASGVPIEASSGDLATAIPLSAIAEAELPSPTARHRRRFTGFQFRKRHSHSISGPALAVVDGEPQPVHDGKKDVKEEPEDDGVKVTIRLAALDEQGTELASPNEQITYLHIVRLGQKPAEPVEGQEAVEDTRPWVVRVVKREATIGPHTFHLHEIFGLTSNSNKTSTPLPAVPSPVHTYPPLETVQSPLAVADDDDPQSECLLCLSSPREVVLLPCRHLVACKDCALNMVEFGAGGNITQATEAVATGVDNAAGADGATGVGGSPAAAATTHVNPRRKRKAKGWFCPVCRQPYTSLLRISTAPPPLDSKEVDQSRGLEDEVGQPAAASLEASNSAANTAEVRSGGGLNALRPAFLRNISLARNAPPPIPADVESTGGLGRVGS